MNIAKNKKLIKIAFLSIITLYLAYLFIYLNSVHLGSNYTIINNLDLIINALWVIIGIFAGFIIFYSTWLKNNNLLSSKKVILNLTFALLLFVLFKIFPFIIAFADFALNGW